jgi:hypothetical protein
MTPSPSRLSTTVVSLLALIALITACSINIDLGDGIDGSGNVETRAFDLSGFDKLAIGSAFEVDVSIDLSAGYKVEVTVDDNLFDELIIEVDNNTLQIRTRSGSRLRSNDGLKATVVLPSLSSVDASGASDVTVLAAGTHVAELEASGASKIRVIDLDAADMKIDASGASKLELGGVRAGALDLDVSGASNVDLEDLPVDTADVSVSGASEIKFGSTAEVTGDLSGASTILVRDATYVDVDTSGSSSADRY